MRILVALLIPLVILGCDRGKKTEPAIEAGPGNYCQLGPIKLTIESARNGKVRMRGMMGQDGESPEDVFVIRTRFKLVDVSVPVKQPPLQRDGMMMGGAGLKLRDESGREFNPVGAGGFGAASGRRTKDEFFVNDTETTDVLTFESVAAATGDLTLEIPATYQLKQPNDAYLQPKDAGTFRFRIPRAFWEAPPPTTEASPGNWATVGPVSVSVESARVGKVKMRGIGGEGDSRDDVLALSVKVKLADPKARVKKPPFIPDMLGPFASPSITLKTPHGESFAVVTSFGLDKIIGRKNTDVELSADKPEFTDLLTFDVKAAKADEVFLTLWPKWQVRQPDGSWADAPLEGEFRFHIPKAMWAK